MKRTFLQSLSFLSLFVFLMASMAYGDNASNKKSQTPTASTSMGDSGTAMEQMTNTPYFSQADGMFSILTLNNNMITDTPVSITLFDMDGDASPLPSITLKAGSITNFPLQDLLKRANASFDSGSIEITYQSATSMSVTAQVGVFDPNARISFESREVDMMDFMSSKMNAIVWIPEPAAQAFLALNNTGTNTVHVQYSFGNEKHELKLRARETRLLNLNEHLEQHGSQGVLLHIEHDAAPGTVIGTGYVINRGNGYSSSFILTDPSTAGSNHLSGAHVPFGLAADSLGFLPGTKFRAPLVVANISAQPVSVSISVDYTRDSQFADLGVAKFQLAPSEIRELDLADKMADLGVYGPIEEAGVDIIYSGTPGSLVAALTSSDLTGGFAIEVPIKDPADMMHMSQGSYPWTLEGGTKTVLHLKNTTNQPQQASVLIRFAGGMYKPDLINLKPYQTVPLDIASLKKSQKKDVTGAVFPKNANSGTIVWSELIPKAMIGRAEQLNVAQGIARSFSCSACPCPSNMNSTSMNPDTFTGQVGYGGNPFAPVYTTEDCNNWTYGPYSAPPPLTWSSQNSSIATVNGSGNVNLIEPGSTAIIAQFTTTVYFPPECQSQQINPGPGAPVTAAQLNCTSSVTRDGSATCSVTPSSGVTVSGWQFKDGSGNTVTRTVNTGSLTWSGSLVTSGTVSVTATGSGASPVSLSQQITVTPRSGFGFSAVSASLQNNGFSGDGCTISVPSPPAQNGDAVGKFCLAQYFSFQTGSVNDSGPNNGYSYVTSIANSNSNGTSTTGYFYVISPDLTNTSSTFYQAQCGNYNAQTNPNGYISGANLLTNAIRHESGTVQSHYENYVVAQNQTTNNLGTVAEGTVGLESASGLASSLTSTLNGNVQTILSATQVEPCSVQQNASCTFQGAINFSPYASCN